MRKFLFLIFLSTLVAPTPILAKEPANSNDLTLDQLKKIQADLKSHKYISVSFEQHLYRAWSKRESKSNGVAKFAMPDRFRWSIDNPYSKELMDEYIYDGKNFYHHSAESKRAYRFSTQMADAKEVMQIVDMVLNLKALFERYDFVEGTRDEDDVLFTIKAKSKQNDVEKIDIVVAVKKSYISLLKLYFINKNTLTINFKLPEFKPFGDEAFSLPKNVKIKDSK